MEMFRVCVLFCVVGVALSSPWIDASAKDKVCAPMQWRALLSGKMFRSANGKKQILQTVRARHYVDYSANVETFQREFTNEGETTIIHAIADFNQMRMYEVDLNRKSCTIRDIPMNDKLRRFCEGDADLKLMGSVTLDGKMADIYKVASQDERMDLTVMRGNFAPVTAVIAKKTSSDSAEMTTYQYSNVSEGVPDRSVFRVPSYCLPPPQLKKVCISEKFEAFSFSQKFNGFGSTQMKFHHARDFVNKLEAATGQFGDGKDAYNVTTVWDWKNQTLYTFRADTKWCNAASTPAPEMIEMCSDSKDLVWLESFYVDGKLADEYAMIFSSTLTATIRVFRDTFELISAINLSTIGGDDFPQMSAIQYGNMTQGIKDSTIFTIADYCF